MTTYTDLSIDKTLDRMVAACAAQRAAADRFMAEMRRINAEEKRRHEELSVLTSKLRTQIDAILSDRRLIDDIADELAGTDTDPDAMAARYGLDAESMVGALETIDVVRCPVCFIWRNPNWENLDRCPHCRNW